MKILVTGASGFVGTSLVNTLVQNGHKVDIFKRGDSFKVTNCEYDSLIHLAARAHILKEKVKNPWLLYKEANINFSLEIANLAKDLRVKRFIYISTVGVHGSNTFSEPFKEEDNPEPHNLYAQSKYQTEILLKEFFKDSNTTLTIIRPPLVYGPNPKANFKKLLSICSLPLPLPFGSITNKRSFVNIYNLVNFIELCCHHPLARNQTFLISDDEDVSTKELIETIRKRMGKKPLLIPIPSCLLSLTLNLLNKKNLTDQLLNNLQIDISKARNLLGWKPVASFNQAIDRTIEAYHD